MKTRIPTTHIEIPYLGFGTYFIADDELAAAVNEALRAGYRHIDNVETTQT